MGWPVDVAPIGVDAQMRLWIWLDQELAGSEAESGFHPPSEIDLVLQQNVYAIRSWFEIHAMTGELGQVPWQVVKEAARKLLRAISAGRARARAEYRDELRQQRNQNEDGQLKKQTHNQ